MLCLPRWLVAQPWLMRILDADDDGRRIADERDEVLVTCNRDDFVIAAPTSSARPRDR